MLYWGFTDDLSVVIMALYAINVYLAYSLTRMVGGAPTGWYIIIASFVLVMVRRGVELYFDVQSTVSFSTSVDTYLSVFVALLFTVGLYMLTGTFRRRLKVAQESRNQP